MGSYQRTKGHNFERELAQKFRDHGYKDAGRNLEYQIENCQGVDLNGTWPYKVQAKCSAKVPNMPQVFKEFTALKADDVPVVMFKVTNKGEYACLRLEDLLALIRRSEYDSKDAAV